MLYIDYNNLKHTENNYLSYITLLDDKFVVVSKYPQIIPTSLIS